MISRVSTISQVLKEGASPQINDLKSFAKKLGYKHFHEINTVESGFLKIDNKLGWNRVTEFISENPQFRTVIITEMSRLSRVKEILFHIQEYLRENKIQLIIKDMDGFALFNSEGKLDLGHDIIFSLYASLVSAEMRQKKERFERAKREYKQQGYSIGGKVLFGYDRISDPNFKNKKTYIINDYQADLIRQIFVWYAYGIDNDLSKTSLSSIVLLSKAKGYPKYLHSKRNVNKLLKERAYIGYKVTNNKIRNPEFFNYKNETAPRYIEAQQYECKYPQIIEESLFDLVQKRLDETNSHLSNNIDKSSSHTTILSKLIQCSYCGSYFIADYRMSKGFPRFSYRCGGNRGAKELRKCEHSQFISLRMLDSAIWTFVKAQVQQIVQFQKQSKSEEKKKDIISRIENLKHSLKSFKLEYKKATNLYNIQFENHMEEASAVLKASYEDIRKREMKVNKEIEHLSHTLEIFNSSEEDISTQIVNNIEKIEKNKQSLYDYIHLLIKSIIPLYNDNRKTILQIIALDNIEESLNFTNEGLPNVKRAKNDGIYFILIKKSNRATFNMRVIDDCIVTYDGVTNEFKTEDASYSFDDIFSTDIEHANGNVLAYSIKEPQITYLKCYDEDIPCKSTLPSEPPTLLEE